MFAFGAPIYNPADADPNAWVCVLFGFMAVFMVLLFSTVTTTSRSRGNSKADLIRYRDELFVLVTTDWLPKLKRAEEHRKHVGDKSVARKLAAVMHEGDAITERLLKDDITPEDIHAAELFCGKANRAMMCYQATLVLDKT